MPKKREPRPAFQMYLLFVRGWAAGCSAGRMPDREPSESFDLTLRVEFAEPEKGVSGGTLTLYGSAELTGGFLDIGRDKRLQGAVWMSPLAAASLATMLAAGQEVVLYLYGSPLYRGKATVRDVAWYTRGHDSIEYELQDLGLGRPMT